MITEGSLIGSCFLSLMAGCRLDADGLVRAVGSGQVIGSSHGGYPSISNPSIGSNPLNTGTGQNYTIVQVPANPYGYQQSVQPAAQSGMFNYGLDCDEEPMSTMLSESPDLPDLVFRAMDENGFWVNLTLRPEDGIIAIEAMRITMMIMAYSTDHASFNALNYVRKHHLERHFKFS